MAHTHNIHSFREHQGTLLLVDLSLERIWITEKRTLRVICEGYGGRGVIDFDVSHISNTCSTGGGHGLI